MTETRAPRRRRTLPNGGLIPLGLDVLVLLALSSRDAAAYARRGERR